MSALEELLQALRTVEDHLDRGQRHLAHAQRVLREAEVALTRIDPDHPETVVPPGLPHAQDRIEHTLTAVDHVAEALRDFAARL
ncbi:hypothetical protein DFQ14_106130 [Halopolyspora algeriensis]|uniref:Uncharacterized protein n=1 Tax=Halopolyspora algeriensis TaxID=1500506 RepID=A0A368VS29_9ACTN|nr:hypothetical protein [Halopolyspora algeriensis]RCW43652.1 hypothetical protein DFQ14_106130 [Halopolyspora algeriensis]TQM47565.1 hypothetical protein FHU43_3559 [Halopolyspora algeriensis]